MFMHLIGTLITSLSYYIVAFGTFSVLYERIKRIITFLNKRTLGTLMVG